MMRLQAEDAMGCQQPSEAGRDQVSPLQVTGTWPGSANLGFFCLSGQVTTRGRCSLTAEPGVGHTGEPAQGTRMRLPSPG